MSSKMEQELMSFFAFWWFRAQQGGAKCQGKTALSHCLQGLDLLGVIGHVAHVALHSGARAVDSLRVTAASR